MLLGVFSRWSVGLWIPSLLYYQLSNPPSRQRERAYFCGREEYDGGESNTVGSFRSNIIELKCVTNILITGTDRGVGDRFGIGRRGGFVPGVRLHVGEEISKRYYVCRASRARYAARL